MTDKVAKAGRSIGKTIYWVAIIIICIPILGFILLCAYGIGYNILGIAGGVLAAIIVCIVAAMMVYGIMKR